MNSSEIVLEQIIGFSEAIAFHRNNRTIALSSGSFVILWELNNFKYLPHHENDVCSLLFSSNNIHLYSAEGGLNQNVCLWNISSLAKIVSRNLPYKSRIAPIKSIIMKESGETIGILENEEQGYRISCWNSSALILEYVSELELEETAVSFSFLDSHEQFVTAEKNSIKIWKHEAGIIRMIRKLNITYNQIDTMLQNSLIYSLSDSGSIILLTLEVFIK